MRQRTSVCLKPHAPYDDTANGVAARDVLRTYLTLEMA